MATLLRKDRRLLRRNRRLVRAATGVECCCDFTKPPPPSSELCCPQSGSTWVLGTEPGNGARVDLNLVWDLRKIMFQGGIDFAFSGEQTISDELVPLSDCGAQTSGLIELGQSSGGELVFLEWNVLLDIDDRFQGPIKPVDCLGAPGHDFCEGDKGCHPAMHFFFALGVGVHQQEAVTTWNRGVHSVICPASGIFGQIGDFGPYDQYEGSGVRPVPTRRNGFTETAWGSMESTQRAHSSTGPIELAVMFGVSMSVTELTDCEGESADSPFSGLFESI